MCKDLHGNSECNFFQYFFMLLCLKLKFHNLMSSGTERLRKNSGIKITRLSLQHMFCLHCCYFRHCGEHMGAVDRSSFHAIPMVDLPLPGLFVYVKLLTQEKTHTRLLMLSLLHQQNKITYSSYCLSSKLYDIL